MTPNALRWMAGGVVDNDREESRSARDVGPDFPGDPRRYHFRDGGFVEEYEPGDER